MRVLLEQRMTADNSSADTHYGAQEAWHRTEPTCVCVCVCALDWLCCSEDTVLIDCCRRRFGEDYCLHPLGGLQINWFCFDFLETEEMSPEFKKPEVRITSPIGLRWSPISTYPTPKALAPKRPKCIDETNKDLRVLRWCRWAAGIAHCKAELWGEEQPPYCGISGVKQHHSNFLHCLIPKTSVLRTTVATDRTVRGSNLGDSEIFRAPPNRPQCRHSLLYIAHQVFPWSKAAEAWCRPPTPSNTGLGMGRSYTAV